MSQVPFQEANRIRNDAATKFKGKLHAAEKMMGYELGAMYECGLKFDVAAEADALWSAMSEFMLAHESGDPCPDPTFFVQYIRAMDLKMTRLRLLGKNQKQERPR